MATRRILVVEDNDDLRDNLAELLQAEGYEVSLAEDGARALAKLSSEPVPDAVIVDLVMPGMDGRELIARMRGEPRLGAVRVVLSTGHASERLRSTTQADAVIAKPFGVRDLLDTLRKVGVAA